MHYFPQMAHDGCISIFRNIGGQYSVSWWYCGETWPNKTRLESTGCCDIVCVTKLMKADDSLQTGFRQNYSRSSACGSDNSKQIMMTSSNGNIFRVTGPLWGEFTGHRWIRGRKACDAELWCFLWSAPWINAWVITREAGDLRRHRAHYDVIVMFSRQSFPEQNCQWSLRRCGSVASVWCQH